jgi:TrmH family RNA methyltransferase
VLLSSKIEEGEGLNRILELCQKYKIRIEQADRALNRVSPKENIFAAAVVQKNSPPLQKGERHLALHEPSDRGNLGTIARSALGFGFLDIAIITPAADMYDPQVIRASMGAVFSLRIKEYDSFESYQAAFPDQNFFPFMLDGAIDLDANFTPPKPPFCLVMGNEGSGLPTSFSNIGQPIRIPHDGSIDSLNLSVAASIGMFRFSDFY